MSESSVALNDRQIIESVWRDQAIWSKVAQELKAKLFVWRYRAAVAGVLGAFLETLAAMLAELDARWWWVRALIALVGAVVLAVVPYIVKTKVSKEQVKNWVRARSASEGLKETAYRYLMGASPFGPAPSPAKLIERCQRIKDQVADLNIYAATIDHPGENRPLTLTADGYLKDRVDDQVEKYYRPKGRQKALAAARLHNVEFGLGLLAVVMGALASAAAATGLKSLAVLGPWVAVVTTASAAVTAHLAASRYDHEAIIYFGTAERLAGLRNRWLADPNRMDPGCVASFVDDCEHAISTENEAWLAKWIRTQSEAAPPPTDPSV